MERIQHRRTVDRVGFARVCHLVTVDTDLSDGAVRLYLLLLRYARDKASCWPGRARLAEDLGVSEATVGRRLAELVERGLVTREQRRDRTAMTWLEDLEAVYNPVPLKFARDVPRKNERDMSSANLSGKRETEEETDMNGGGLTSELTSEQRQTLDTLTGFGVSDGVALKLAHGCELSDVVGWIEHASHASGLHSPVGFVVAKLRDSEPVPDHGQHEGRRRDSQGEYADLIQT